MKIATRCCPIVELRQYTLHPGQRDVLVELFEREFIEPQVACGRAGDRTVPRPQARKRLEASRSPCVRVGSLRGSPQPEVPRV